MIIYSLDAQNLHDPYIIILYRTIRLADELKLMLGNVIYLLCSI